eukprot:1154454-Pelagomonas_calceolata.AAC.1
MEFTCKLASSLAPSTSLVRPPQECHHMDSAHHILSGWEGKGYILSGCQCPVIRNMADRLAQLDLHITEHCFLGKKEDYNELQ